MKRFTAIISTLTVIASLTACSEAETPAQNVSENQSSSQSSTSSQESTVSQGLTSSKESSSTENSSSQEDYDTLRERDYELKGEDLIAKFKWPYDAPIEVDGMASQKMTTTMDKGDVYNDIEISELSNEFYWRIVCDYGYLATAPESGDNFEFKKYKKGDKIGDFTVKEIATQFDNVEWLGLYNDYFQGVKASFDGEITLTGELAISLEGEDDFRLDEIVFYPDEESCKELPIVNYEPLLDPKYNFKPKVYDVSICLGDEEDYPEIDFTGIPTHSTHVKAKIKIKDYEYHMLSIPGLNYCGYASIADGKLELL